MRLSALSICKDTLELSNGVDKEHPALVAFAKYQTIDKLTPAKAIIPFDSLFS